MKKPATRFSLLLALMATHLLIAIEGYAGTTYPLPPSLPSSDKRRRVSFKPQLSQHCLAVKVKDPMIKGYHVRSFNLTFNFQADGSIADIKIERKWGWANNNIPVIEFSAEDFAVNYGWLTVNRDGWELQAFSHRYIDNYITISFGLNAYRPMADDGSLGDITKIYLVVFQQLAGGEERIFRSASNDAIKCP